jgi:hypothetical protein
MLLLLLLLLCGCCDYLPRLLSILFCIHSCPKHAPG